MAALAHIVQRTASATPSTGRRSRRLLSAYDKLIQNVHKNRSTGAHAHLSLTQTVLCGHRLDNTPRTAIASSLGSTTRKDDKTVHELPPSCDNLLAARVETDVFPGGLFFGDDDAPAKGDLSMLSVRGKEVTRPRVVGVRLAGDLSGWTTPRDIHARVSDLLEATDERVVLAYHGPGTDSISCADRAALGAMAAERGASALFPFTDLAYNPLCATGHRPLAYAASTVADVCLRPDTNAMYDDLIELQLDRLDPFVRGPFSQHVLTPLRDFKHRTMEEDWPERLSAVTITIDSADTLDRVVRIAKQAWRKGLSAKAPMLLSVAPGAVVDKHQTDLFERVGALIVSSHGLKGAAGDAEWISIMTNASDGLETLRYKGNPNTHAFAASTEIVTAMSFAGKLTFNPIRDRVVGRDGVPFQFTAQGL